MESGSWRGCREWHDLLDAVCNDGGHYDNTELAGDFCARTGRTGQADFEAAKKKLGGWRSGRRVPRRGSMVLLADMLGIDRDPELVKQWSALYRAASRKDHRAVVDAAAPAATGSAAVQPNRTRPWILVSVLPVLVGAGIAAAMVADDTPSVELPAIGYNAHVRVSLGASLLIHGESVGCDGPPPAWEQIVPWIPSTRLGTFADGGLARKMVNDCGKEMVVRAVMFTGTSAGSEEVRLLGDYMKIDVIDGEASPSGGRG